MLIDYGSNHRFINWKLSKLLNCFIYLALKFQVMIANGGNINCLGKCYIIKLTMGANLLNSPIIAIQMGSFDVVLGV